MARRRQSQVRSRRQSRQLVVEALEGRRLLAANVAVASDAWGGSLPRVRLIDSDTGVEQASVLAFESTFKGGVRPALGRITGNAAADLVVGSGSGRVAEVRVFKPVTSDGATTLTRVLSFKPFGDRYKGGIDVAVGDVDGDTTEDLVVSKSRDGGEVKIFRMTNSGGTLTQALYATIAKPFGSRFNGGSSVGVADVGEFANGALVKSVADNKVEVLVGSGAGINAKVLVYDLSKPDAPRVADTIDSALTGAFGRPFQGGVSVAGSRYAASGVAGPVEAIVVSARRGGGARTTVYDGTVAATANTVLKSFATYKSTERQNAATFVAPVDANGDGQVDRFLSTQGDPGGPAGIARVGIDGTRNASQLGTLAGPLRIATARTVFQPQTISAVTKVASEGVPVGTTRTMEIRELVTGTGAVAEAGRTLEVQYTGMLTDGTVFDTSRKPDRTSFKFTLGAGQVIAGWDAGFAGMKVGGRRLLAIPPELAYGDAGSGSLIKKGAKLIFDVELVSVT